MWQTRVIITLTCTNFPIIAIVRSEIMCVCVCYARKVSECVKLSVLFVRRLCAQFELFRYQRL